MTTSASLRSEGSSPSYEARMVSRSRIGSGALRARSPLRRSPAGSGASLWELWNFRFVTFVTWQDHHGTIVSGQGVRDRAPGLDTVVLQRVGGSAARR